MSTVTPIKNCHPDRRRALLPAGAGACGSPCGYIAKKPQVPRLRSYAAPLGMTILIGCQSQLAAKSLALSRCLGAVPAVPQMQRDIKGRPTLSSG